MKKIIWILACILSHTISAQETHIDQSQQQLFDQIHEAFDERLYGRVLALSDQYQSRQEQANHDFSALPEAQVQLWKHLAALYLEREGAAIDLEHVLLQLQPDHLINDAYFALADYHYERKEYESAIHYYNLLDTDLYSDERYVKATFQQGYSYFVTKDFANAERNFLLIRDIKGQYYYPSNYYYGMVKYYDRDYDSAIKSFDRVAEASQYRAQIPYYISQIYFAQGKYTDLIPYAEREINKPTTGNIKEIRQLLGQAYFKQGKYKQALPHLTYYEQNTDKLSIDEFYQLAFTQYQLGLCEAAIPNFKELTNLDSKQGQMVNYYLADCYTKTGDMTSAKAAFKKVSQMNYEPRMQEEALFNFGKLSAELNNDREAINTLIKVAPSSPYYNDTKPIINDILIHTDDYDNAISILESIDRTPELNRTYHATLYKRGLQLYTENKTGKAKVLFEQAAGMKADPQARASSQYWIAKDLHDQSKYEASSDAMDEYYIMAENVSAPMPVASSKYMADYTQGYNYLRQQSYRAAGKKFKSAIVGINQNREQIDDSYILDRVLPDALTRAGDCAFTSNDYDNAQRYYNQAIDRKPVAVVYLLYQRALIEGLQGKPYEKILTLEEIIEKHPNSAFVDDALMQLGDTYLALGNTDSATSTYTDLILNHYGKSPFINAALLKKGLISYNRGNLPEALQFYKRVFTNNPTAKEAQAAMIAIEEIYVEDLKDANRYFAYVDSFPQYAVSDFEKDSLSYVIAQKQFNTGDYDAAIEDFSNYLDKYPKGSNQLSAHFYRAEALSILNRYGAANADYEAVIESGYSPHYEDALRKSAIINYNHVQDFDNAYKYYNMLAEHTTGPELKYEAQLGALRSAFRISKDDAVLRYAQLVSSSPYKTVSEELAAQYYLAKVSYRKKLTDQALIAFDQIAKRGSNNQAAESRYMVAQILYDRKELDNAEVAITNANNKNSAYPTWVAKGLILLSKIYVDKGDLFNARAAVEAVIENFKNDSAILADAQKQLAEVKRKESQQSRIKEVNDNRLELDTTNTGN